MPGSVTEPIQEPPRPLTLLADNARKPLGEVEDPLRLHNTSGASFARYILPRSWLCPDPMAHGNSQALLTTEPPPTPTVCKACLNSAAHLPDGGADDYPHPA